MILKTMKAADLHKFGEPLIIQEIPENSPVQIKCLLRL